MPSLVKKGWNIKRIGEQKKKKKELMDELYNIDCQAKLRELSQEEWIHRYKVERHLEDFYVEEELYWRQRMDKHWLVAGDSNTKFFHQFANGRRRKGTIMQLETDQGMVTTQEEIMCHAIQFYKNLFGLVDLRHIFYQVIFGLIKVKSRRLTRKS